MLRESRPLLSCGVVAAKQQRPFAFGGRRQIGTRRDPESLDAM
jgi:hypothetical protein